MVIKDLYVFFIFLLHFGTCQEYFLDLHIYACENIIISVNNTAHIFSYQSKMHCSSGSKKNKNIYFNSEICSKIEPQKKPVEYKVKYTLFFTPNILHVFENGFKGKFVPLSVTSTLGVLKRVIISLKEIFSNGASLRIRYCDTCHELG